MLPAGEGSQHVKDWTCNKGSKGATTPVRKGEIWSNSAFPRFGTYQVVTTTEAKSIIHEMTVRSWLRETDTGTCWEDRTPGNWLVGVILYGPPAVSKVNACSDCLKDWSHFCMETVAAFSCWDKGLLDFFFLWNLSSHIPSFLGISDFPPCLQIIVAGK